MSYWALNELNKGQFPQRNGKWKVFHPRKIGKNRRNRKISR